jgi:hypothetical protein
MGFKDINFIPPEMQRENSNYFPLKAPPVISYTPHFPLRV